MTLYDISPPLSERLAVWPGDTPLSREVLCDLARGDTVTLSTLRATTHLGAHADAPSHYAQGAPNIDRRSLDYYLGPCQLVHFCARPLGRFRITPDWLPGPVKAERVLFATGSYPTEPTQFNKNFGALSPELIEALHDQGVKLVGIDTPSVDLFDSKDLPTHQACLRHDIAILEGLVLADVPAGLYELIALPLKLVGFDASPVRAVLRTIP